MIKINYNPDVLSCLANLSNDEVFTPPKLANEVLDLLPTEIWKDPKTTFLDPVSKSGIFLREIAKRLMVGLEEVLPDEQERRNHIFTKQLFAVSITELTALLSRRSVYCSKAADGKYSICEGFNSPDGNIFYERQEHLWIGNNCQFCGANKAAYDRGGSMETYAYNFIHTDKPENIFKMKFDVIVGNPPYQLNDGGGKGSSAKPIYHHFIDQAKKLNPRYLSMIVPARWYSGGKGLDDFRGEMLNDKRISKLVDFADSRECFPGVDIAGGVCYFLWEKEHSGPCEVLTIRKGVESQSYRNLNEFETFVRDNIAVDIIHKILSKTNEFMNSTVSSRMPFGLTSNVKFEKVGDLDLITSAGKGKISSFKVTSGQDLIQKWKVLLSKASNDHGGQPDKEGKRRIFSRIEVMAPGTVCSESYLVVGGYETEREAQNMTLYLKTQFCRFLVSTILLTQNITKGKFIFVPNLPMDREWTDELLYKTFDINQAEQNFINQLIRPINQ